MSWREIAEICYIRYARRPDHKSVKHIATSGPPPTQKTRRYQPWHEISDPAERKLAVVRLHGEGWSVTSIAEYLQCTRHTIYDTLERWAKEGSAYRNMKSVRSADELACSARRAFVIKRSLESIA